MAKQKKKKPRANTTIDPADMRSWKIDDHRLQARAEFSRRLSSPGYEQERIDCINVEGHAKTKFAEWGLFYIEGQKDPANFPIFDPAWGKTKIPSTTVFSVYEERRYRPKRDEQVVLILPVTGTTPETIDQVWRCTYTPYLDKKTRAKRKSQKRTRK